MQRDKLNVNVFFSSFQWERDNRNKFLRQRHFDFQICIATLLRVEQF